MGRTPTRRGRRTICSKNSLKEAWRVMETIEQAARPNPERNKWTAAHKGKQLAGKIFM